MPTKKKSTKFPKRAAKLTPTQKLAVKRMLAKSISILSAKTCPKCKSSEIGYCFPTATYDCHDCNHEWKVKPIKDKKTKK